MSGAVDLGGKVRSRDPQASWGAAAMITSDGWSQLQRAIYRILLVHSPLTDDEIYDHFFDLATNSATRLRSPQRVRTARKELHLQGFVRVVDDEGTSRLGNRSQRWGAASIPLAEILAGEVGR